MARSSTTMQKGETRNPSGRPKKGESLSELMRIHLDAIGLGATKSNKELLVEKIFQLAYVNGDATFVKMIWNYVDGMPKQSSEIQVTETAYDMGKYSDEELILILEQAFSRKAKVVDAN